MNISFKPAIRQTYSFEWNPRFERRDIEEPHPTGPEIEWGVATGGGGGVYLNGKQCKDYVPK